MLLQEVIPLTADYIIQRLSNYDCYFTDEDMEEQEGEKGSEDEKDEEKDKENDKDEESKEDGTDEEDDEDEENEGSGYFIGTLVKKSSVSFIHAEIIDFPFSLMGRNLLKINVSILLHI